MLYGLYLCEHVHVCNFVFLSIVVSMCMSVNVCVSLSVFLFVTLCLLPLSHLSVFLSYLTFCLYICASINISIYMCM